MNNKIDKIIFIVLFFLFLGVPLLTTNFKKNVTSEDENRILAPMPELYDTEGNLNKDFSKDFETWINDNIGFRTKMVINNARIQYYVFKILANNSDFYLGPRGELNYATPEMISDYQHLNLYPEEYLNEFSSCLQYIKDFTNSKGADFYYYQCWDKHSIYPEQFPQTVYQFGNISKTDEVVRAIEENTDIIVISPKKELIAEKCNYDTYGYWCDASHWTPRGSKIGYRVLMNAINNKSDKNYKILEDYDYDIVLEDKGYIIFGGIHEEDVLETFSIKNNNAVITNDKLGLLSEDYRSIFLTNNNVDNDTRILILGDSYFRWYIVDDIAQSFHETIMLYGGFFSHYAELIEQYQPDIVIIENAEREDRTNIVISTVKEMRKNQ